MPKRMSKVQYSMLPNDKSVTIRYQILSDVITVRPYIQPLENDDPWTDGKFWITDDPYHLAMGKLAELGRSNIIKTNTQQVNSLFQYLHGMIKYSWDLYQEAKEDYRIRKLSNPDRRTGIGMRLGMVARIDKPLFIPNFHCKYPYTLEFSHRDDNGDVSIKLYRYIDDRKVKRYSREAPKSYYHVIDLSIDVNGQIIRTNDYHEFMSR